mgnify:CR=1 FL=1
MASAVNSLGLGSQGALNFDIIDQLRDVDNNTQVKPLEAKLTQNDILQSDLSILTTFTASLKSMTSSLSSENTYLKRTTNVTGTSASITAASGTTIQDVNIDVTNLAQKDVYESRAFASKTSNFTAGADTIELSIDGQTYNIDVDATTTLEQFKDKVFDETDGKISASILNVGGDDPYKLILQSSQTGESNAITISSAAGSALSLGLANYEYTGDTAGTFSNVAGDTLTFNINGTNYDIAVNDGDTVTDISNKIVLNHGDVLNSKVENGVLLLESLDENMSISSLNGSDVTFGLSTMAAPTQSNHIQNATDASFKFGGVDITRSSNTFDDLVVGINITLNEPGVSNASITQDTSEVSSSLESFVTKYNELMSNLNESTKHDVDKKTAGNFQNVSEIKTLKASINRQLLSVDSEGRSLSQYGVELNSSGILEFNSSTFNSKMSTDSAELEGFFRGATTNFQTSITGSSITGPIDFTSGDLLINDTEIVVNLNNGTSELNAQALRDAINSANITGVEAILNNDGNGIKLISDAGSNIAVTGDSAKLLNAGLNVGTTYGNSETTEGYFSKFNSLLSDYISGDDSILELYETQLQTKNSSLLEEKDKTIRMLDTKYEVMAKKFAAYDGIIGQLNSQFQSLSLMIQQSVTSK